MTANTKGFMTEEQNGVLKVRSCAWSPPGDHPVGCGVILTVKDGKVIKVEGDPDHPITQGRLCPRCLALDEVMYSPERIMHPIKRAREDRGRDAWEQISWDEAYDMIEAKVRDIWENWGAETIFTLVGTGRECTLYAPVYGPAVMNTPNGNSTAPFSGQACYGPRCTVTNYLLGSGYPEMDFAQYFPDRYDDPRYELPKYLLIWGKDPLYSNPDGFFGHSVIDVMKRGTKLIVVDPRVTWLAAHAEYHLQLRPGTDTVVGMGMIKILIEEELYNKEFVDLWCYGMDALYERVKEWTPERVQEVAWVDPDQLLGATRAFATNAPSTALWGVALDQSRASTQAGMCFLDIIALCGYLDIPGGIVLARPTSFIGQWRYDMTNTLTPEMKKKVIRDPHGKYLLFNKSAAMGGVQGDTLLNYLEGVLPGFRDDEVPFKLRMCWMFGTNPIACMADQPQRWYKALLPLDFVVVNDIFMTPTIMAVADLVLPLATFAEHNGLVTPHFGRNTHMIGAMNKAVDAGDTKSDLEILIEMGKRLRPELWTEFDTPEEFFDKKLQETYGFGYDDLRNEVIHQMPFKYRKYETGELRADGNPGFDTPSGRIEFYSLMLPNVEEDALPYYEEPEYSPYSQPEDVVAEFPLVYTTGGRNLCMFHSEHRQIPSLRAMHKDPLVSIHPDTAVQYGIEEGDWVTIESPLGKCTQRAKLTLMMDPRVVHIEHGWWFPEQDGEAPNLFGVWDANANNLIPHESVGITGYGAPYKNGICKIYKVSGLKG